MYGESQLLVLNQASNFGGFPVSSLSAPHNDLTGHKSLKTLYNSLERSRLEGSDEAMSILWFVV